jgi:superfamily II DNA helicase RecQ
MQVKVFSIRIDSVYLEQDQQMLNEFLATVTFKKSSSQFVETDEPHWSVLLHYEVLETENLMQIAQNSYEDLTSKDKQVYGYLNQWRTDKSEELKFKKFIICHNSHLIDLALYKPSNLDELQQIKGFGKQRAEKYGEDILAILNAV